MTRSQCTAALAVVCGLAGCGIPQAPTAVVATPAAKVRPAELTSWAAKVAATVRPNVVFPEADNIVGNPGAEFDVRMSPDGTIYSIVLVKVSGNLEWDLAALRALRKTERLPLDNDYMPPRAFITLRPKR